MARTDGSSAVIRMGKAYAGPEGKRLCSELTAGLGRAGALYIGEKAFTCVLSWAYQNLASSQFGQDKATVDVLGMCIYAHPFSIRGTVS